MLDTIGVDCIDGLFADIPKDLLLKRALNVPPAASEPELEADIRRRAAENTGATSAISFQGGGVYDHFIPAAVDEVVGRGEFYTAYTPYQPEASQGSLQAFFEFQTLLCRLTAMDVANASLYEGGTAVTEAVLMSTRINRGSRRVVILESIHPEYRDVLSTYLTRMDTELITVPTPDGTADPDAVRSEITDDTACLVVQYPNFFGCLEQVHELSTIARKRGVLLVASFDPLALGILQPPGEWGADIAVAEGQSLGIPLQYGGPLLGILTCRQEHVRSIPGRLVGRADDRLGNECFVLNLQTREQHIRRNKATSNICTNQGLLALRATVHLSLLGPQGLREASELCCRKAHYAAGQLATVDGLRPLFDRPFYKEFALHARDGGTEIVRKARRAGFELGPLLKRFGSWNQSDCAESLLVAVTEKRTREEIDTLVEALKS